MILENITSDIREEQLAASLVSAKKVAKWEKTGLLEGLNKAQKFRMARLLENEAKALLEASDTSDIKGFQAIAFPMVRRVMGSLLAQEIASVQPMSLPSGLMFWLDFTFGTNKAGVGAGDWFGAGRSIYGDPTAPLTGGTDATGGHYYLHNSYTQLEFTGTVGIASSGSATWKDVEFDPELSGAVSIGNLFKMTVDLDQDASIGNIDATNYKSFAVSGAVASLGAGALGNLSRLYRRHNSYNPTTKVLTMYFSGNATPGTGGGVNSGSNVTVSYVRKDVLSADTTGTTLNPAFEYAFDNSNWIPEIDIKLASMPVTSNSRKLKVRWTPEVAQDLNAYHTLDAEAELTQVMADQVALDIDAEILVDMVNSATAGTLYWDARPGFFLNKETGERMSDVTNFTGNVNEWYQTLMITIHDLSNIIHRKNLRSGANFIVVGTDVATILESLQTWRPALDMGDTSQLKFSMGVEKVGTLANRYTVYKVPFFYRNKVLVGYKGDDWLSTGYVYAPYVPMIVTPTIYDPTNLHPVKGLMTRYGKQCVRGDYFGVVVVKGLLFN